MSSGGSWAMSEYSCGRACGVGSLSFAPLPSKYTTFFPYYRLPPCEESKRSHQMPAPWLCRFYSPELRVSLRYSDVTKPEVKHQSQEWGQIRKECHGQRVCYSIWGGSCHGRTTPLCKDFQNISKSFRQINCQVNYISINCYSCLPNKITWVHVTQGITGCHQAVPKMKSQNKQSFQPQPSGSFSLFPTYINFFKKGLFSLCIHVFPAFMNLHHLCAWCPQKLEEGVRSQKP